MKIGILYIAVGKYDIFFNDFYQSCEKNFLPDCDKMYYIWTDSSKIPTQNNISKFPLEKRGWPFDTMMRFHNFSDKKETLLLNDYLFFFNANMMVEKVVNKDEVLGNPLVGALHPHFYASTENTLPYERSDKSSLKIPYGWGDKYYQGCFNGGKAEKFLEMSSILKDKIDLDLNQGHTPIWHDESALNWYFNKNREEIKTLSSSYVYPESMDIPFERKIIQRDKSKLGGHEFLRS